MLVSVIMFIKSAVGIHRKRPAQTSILAGKCALAEPGQEIGFQQAPVALPGHTQGLLAQLVFAVTVLDRIGLVDDVDEVAGFGHAPEHLDGAGLQRDRVATIAIIGLSNVEVRAFIIHTVQSGPGDKHPLVTPVFAAPAEIAFQNERGLNIIGLAGIGRILGEPAGFSA